MTRPDYSKIRVLLIEGRARQIMPLMESMHRLGCHVATFNTSRLDMGWASRFPDEKLLVPCDMNDPDAYWNAVGPILQSGRFDVAIPMFDFSAEILARHKAELQGKIYLAVNDWDVFQFARDKLKTMRVCMENGLPCPKTVLAEDPAALASADLQFPVCVKPRSGSSAVGFRMISSPSDLLPVVQATAAKYGPPLVQEYIPQTDLQYKAELFVDKHGDVQSACVFSKVRWYPIDGGSSTLNETVHRPDIVENCAKLLRLIRWRGYADVDLIQDPRDGVAKIMEINPRITGSVKICYSVGVDFSEQILQDYLDVPVTPYLDYPAGRYLRYLHTDILWFLKSPNRFRAKPSWFDFRKSVDQIWSARDPLPWFAYTLASIAKLKHDKQKRSLK